MISALVSAAVARVAEELGEVLPGAGERVVAGPRQEPKAADTPLLVLGAGELRILETAREPRAGAPRPQGAEERLVLQGGRLGPYPLARRPLDGTTRARLVLAEGTVAERVLPLLAGADFGVDPATQSIHLAADPGARHLAHAGAVAEQIQARAGRSFDVSSPREVDAVLHDQLGLPRPGARGAAGNGAGGSAEEELEPIASLHPVVPLLIAHRAMAATPPVLRVEYSFPGIFTSREFRQEMLLQVYHRDAAAAEILVALATAAILTHHDELLAAGRQELASRRGVGTLHLPTGIELLGSAAPTAGDPVARVVRFEVAGQLRFTREVRDAVGLIEQISSPGATGSGPVSVRVDVA